LTDFDWFVRTLAVATANMRLNVFCVIDLLLRPVYQRVMQTFSAEHRAILRNPLSTRPYQSLSPLFSRVVNSDLAQSGNAASPPTKTKWRCGNWMESLIRIPMSPSPVFCIRLPSATRDVQQICGERTAWS
jgi:hypothetical protein